MQSCGRSRCPTKSSQIASPSGAASSRSRASRSSESPRRCRARSSETPETAPDESSDASARATGSGGGDEDGESAVSSARAQPGSHVLGTALGGRASMETIRSSSEGMFTPDFTAARRSDAQLAERDVKRDGCAGVPVRVHVAGSGSGSRAAARAAATHWRRMMVGTSQPDLTRDSRVPKRAQAP